MSRTIAFIQARMSSSRFPGKVLEPIGGVPMIVYMVRRVMRARHLDSVVVVTSTDGSDDPVVAALRAEEIPTFRGDLDDVLTRFFDAAVLYDAEEVVRLTGDCPLIDAAVIDAVVDARRNAAADYASNFEPPTFPDGLDVECFTREVLERTHRMATRVSEREHVTLWMRSDEARLRCVNYCAVANLSALRLTVDYADDLVLVRRLIEQMQGNGDFDLFDILRALSTEPLLLALNQHERNEGLAHSLAAERKK